jgi:hypothetical protein
MPDNSWRVPESFWKLSGIFRDEKRKCSGLPKPLLMLFAEEITKPKLFRNALKIILVGTGNVLSPHKYFQFIWTLKNVVVNSEGRFWIFWKSTFWDFPKRCSRRGRRAWHLMGGGGVPPHCGRQRVELHHGAPHGTPIWHIPFWKGICQGYFGVLV